jgi:hypothetical protein
LAVAVAAVALAGFVVVERRAPEPVLPFPLFRRRVIAVSSVAGALIGGVLIATTTFLPLYVQAVLGGTPTDAGLSIAPMAIGWPLASALAGRLLPRTGYRPLVRLGLGLTVAATLTLSLVLHRASSLYVPRATSVLLGLGLGFANTTLLVAVQGSVGWGQRGVATASTLLCRTLGGALAVGVLGALLSAALASDAALSAGALDVLSSSHRGHGLDAGTLTGGVAALDRGLRSVFRVIVGIAAAAFGAGILFPKLTIEMERKRDSLRPSGFGGMP